ncbi:MAG: putative 2-C-methyl-D-erythritol 4-phosphate cytidylyltransferase 2 [Candidatus Ordinivivax streblomastigis]|uniref:2-C-methyl-D-erythritol 4-phosphate cytidylyltransferase n=1 Tax=Candidatus Ordinivivax streblomastigis TaxID=2540710 RepID=A0A5M8P084_9BACT|nr:MAG: putative 2-C-methyl-D-erythritol 4-phosphate cytidylyltransferase 2 [Candidatus Ordinivivax streblomastigis]
MTIKYVIVVAGGKGLRMGTDIPKQFLLLNGKPVLMHTLEAFQDYDSQIRLILVLPGEQQNYWRELCKQYHFQLEHQIVSGGETRFHSVQNGLKFVTESDWVAVHDGVRPLAGKSLIAGVFDMAEKEKAAYPAIPVVDTLREKSEDGAYRVVDRSHYFLVQTPQVFASEVLLSAYQTEYSETFTDDVSVVEASGLCCPKMIEGKRENIKITTPVDLLIAEALLKNGY